jgi:hypothetical protein
MVMELVCSAAVLAAGAVGLYAAHCEEKRQKKQREKRRQKQSELEGILRSDQFTEDEAAVARLYQKRNACEIYNVARRLNIEPERYEQVVAVVDEYKKELEKLD